MPRQYLLLAPTAPGAARLPVAVHDGAHNPTLPHHDTHHEERIEKGGRYNGPDPIAFFIPGRRDNQEPCAAGGPWRRWRRQRRVGGKGGRRRAAAGDYAGAGATALLLFFSGPSAARAREQEARVGCDAAGVRALAAAVLISSASIPSATLRWGKERDHHHPHAGGAVPRGRVARRKR